MLGSFGVHGGEAPDTRRDANPRGRIQEATGPRIQPAPMGGMLQDGSEVGVRGGDIEEAFTVGNRDGDRGDKDEDANLPQSCHSDPSRTREGEKEDKEEVCKEDKCGYES